MIVELLILALKGREKNIFLLPIFRSLAETLYISLAKDRLPREKQTILLMWVNMCIREHLKEWLEFGFYTILG